MDAPVQGFAPGPLRVLLVEDSAADAELLVRELQRLPRPVRHLRVESAAALDAALDEFTPDIVLSDYSMPSFSGPDALAVVLRRAPEVPFVFVSGTIGEERAIEALQRGAWDYVLKDNLRRLPMAIERALGHAAERAERSRVQRALRESEARFRSIVESSQDWIWENDGALRVTYSNGAVEAILGYAPEELEGRAAIELMHEEDRAAVEAFLPELIRERRGWRRWRLRWRHREGQWRVLESTAEPRFDEDGRLLGFRGIDHDVTDTLQQEARLREYARIHALLGAIGNLVLRTTSHQELLLNACRVAVEQGGFSAAGIALVAEDGRTLQVARTSGDRAVLEAVDPQEPMSLAPGSPYLAHPSVRALLEKRVVAIPDIASGPLDPTLRGQMLERGVRSQITLPLGTAPWGLLALYAAAPRAYDAEELALLQRLADEIDYAVDFLAKGERLRFLAHHNPVTGLPNRIPFQQRLAQLLGQGPVAVAALDLVQFDHISSSRGRTFGEALLVALAGRLQRELPDADLAHPEADTFLLCRPAAADPEDESRRLQACLEAVGREPFVIEGERVHASLRAGLAVGAGHGSDESGEALERHALAALAEAAELGLDLRLYSDQLSARMARRIQLEHDLRGAIAEHQFELHYQPKFDAHTRRLAGAEALLRWRHPREGLVPPGEFIPVLEATGLLVPVGRWVVREALATAQAWRALDPAFRIAVNVSARELRQADFLEAFHAVLGPTAPASPIDVEVTESVVMVDVQQSVRLLQALRGLGCRVAIDDFGTGYSSLNYLVQLPVDTLKIDRSFVAMLGQSPETVSLVTNTIALAHALGLDVVAEGVETEAQAEVLRDLGCELLQGFLLGHPLPREAFARQFLGG